MSLADPLVDVRIATWLVMPDCCDLTDSPSRVSLKKGENRWNLEGLLTQRAGKDAVTSTLTVLRTVSGEGKVALYAETQGLVIVLTHLFGAMNDSSLWCSACQSPVGPLR